MSVPQKQAGCDPSTCRVELILKSMAMRFQGKVALVTGGGSGIGLASAKRLSSEGAKVAIVGRTQDKLEKAAERIRSETKGEVLVMAGDMSSESDVKTVMQGAVDKFGGLDCVYLNAGAPPCIKCACA